MRVSTYSYCNLMSWLGDIPRRPSVFYREAEGEWIWSVGKLGSGDDTKVGEENCSQNNVGKKKYIN